MSVFSYATWANSSFLNDDYHMKVLEECVLLNFFQSKLIFHNNGKGVFDIGIECVNALHWSRQFEWPWAIIESNLSPKDTVLEVGGGDTLLQFALAKRCQKVINIDRDLNVIQKLKESELFKLIPVNLRCEDGENLPYEDNTFDKVFCISVMEHSENPIKMAQELYRVLKPNGKLICTIDVTEKLEANIESVDLQTAIAILKSFNINLPKTPKNILNKDGLFVLCFSVMKDNI